MIDLGHRRDRRFSAATGYPLLNRYARRQTGDKIDVRLFKLFDELSRIRRHAVEETALPFRKQTVERESRFSGAAQAGDHDHLVARNFHVDVFQIMLARTVDPDSAVRSVDLETWRRFRCASELNVLI